MLSSLLATQFRGTDFCALIRGSEFTLEWAECTFISSMGRKNLISLTEWQL